ncbi:helix-turn-helix domain-containing protein [Streptomyces sp. VRA16 Mangrove soil]|uniref:helix-turn-helix domain-containing protein n=1 Tax=Streptomyces sp. VRA16 Mangrove soil TaxID=2817434 RepID=UPI001A9F87FB|nr:helix-turn-helix domain-containing protein [Streptomyces sp. VRA16 Mangrove soil]MBO1331417.1 helix-turn-helix domain-containing protein [Streptomyces sp. VRA16 Mangrove soil]
MGHEDGDAAPFGRMLRALRQERRLTIEELAEASGVSGRAIGDMERGRSRRPHRGTVTALAQGLRLGQAAHTELLNAARAARVGAQSPQPVKAVPFALPRGVRDFVGRGRELTTLRTLAQEAAQEPREGTSAPPVAVVSGPPGSGKTTLAVRLAEELGPVSPDGTFLVDMRGLEAQPLTTEETVLRLLAAWGVGDGELSQHGAEEHLARYHAVAAGLRAVLVLDNAADEAQIRPLLPREGRLLVVVTSRRTLAGLEGVRRVELGALSDAESAALLRAVLGAGRVDAEPVAADTVTELCGHLPLALRVAANWAATRSNWSLRRLADRLADEERRLDALSAGDLRVGAAFGLSYSRLAPEAARMFRLLSLVPGQDFSLAPAAVLAGAAPHDAEDVLEELLEAGLLMTSREDRYRFHDLLRLYAGARLRAEDGAQIASAARTRLRHWLLDTAVLAGRWHEPGYGAPPPDPGRLVPLDDSEQAMRWIKTERDNWIAAFRDAAEQGEHRRVAELAEAMHWFSDHWVSSGVWVEVYERAAAAAAALDDAALEATHRNYLAWAYQACEGRYDEAVASATSALARAEQAGDIVQRAWAYNYLGWLKTVRGDFGDAVEPYRLAMELFDAADDITGYLAVSGGMTRVLNVVGRPKEALENHERVMAVITDPRNSDRIPPSVRDFSILAAVYAVSYVHLRQEDWQRAADALFEVREQFAPRGWYLQAGRVHLYLARCLAHLGRTSEAADEYRAVLASEERLPPDLPADARAGLDALAAGLPVPDARITW